MNVFKSFFKTPTHFRPVVGFRRNGRLYHYNDEEYREQIIKHISILKKVGFKKGSKVAIMAETSIEWHLFDIAATLSGGIVIPIYTTFSSRDFKSILKLSEPDIIIFQGTHLRNEYKKIVSKNISILNLVEDDRVHQGQTDFNYQLLLDETRQDEEGIDLYELIKERNAEDICSYLVTSGTTGTPKIASFSFSSLNSVLENVQWAMRGRVKPGSRSLTSLPLAHVLGRCDSLLHFVLPVHTIFGESIETFVSDIQMIKPSYMVTVPRILTKIKERVLRSISNEGRFTEALFRLAFDSASNYYDKVSNGSSPSRYETKAFTFFQKGILRKIREKISPDLDFLVTGGAPLFEEDFIFFRNIGIPVLEGYGLTETLGPICMNPIEDPQNGNVGHPFKDVQIKIDTEGEILIKSPYVLKEYLGHDNQESFDSEGFLKTGDIGDVTIDGRLKITDRKKDIIVNAYGKNIYPLKIESLFTTSPLIDNILVTGEGRPYLTALLFTSRERFVDLIEDGTLDPTASLDQLIALPEVQTKIENEVQRLNAELGHHEKIKKFSLIPLQIEASDSFITPSLKLKREHIYNKFQKEINKLYSE
ncbi:MAG: AMP-binding protein [Halobacteriovoraceae bacterium]|nr:AMP-binding protein [Halobacteriovoraceae bacterium]